MGQGDKFQTSICFLKKLCMKLNQGVSSTFQDVSICFGNPRIKHTIKITSMKPQTVDPQRYAQF